ncbi:hypothetical protein ACFX2J_046561 [Malus domestica]
MKHGTNYKTYSSENIWKPKSAVRAYTQFTRCFPSKVFSYTQLSVHAARSLNVTDFDCLQNYSGREFTRFGRSVDWSFLVSFSVTLQDSNVRDFKFFSVFKCSSPEFVIR